MPVAAGSTTTSAVRAADAWQTVGSTKAFGSFLDAVVRDVERFWREEYPKAYGSPLPGNLRLFAATARSSLPRCGRFAIEYGDVRNNAFYCQESDYVVWDDDRLFPAIVNNFGDFGAAIVVAHEVGHAIQVRANVNRPSIVTELQADCFSGAWLGSLSANRAVGVVAPSPAVLDDAVASVLSFRDRPGRDPSRPGSHGNGFDRVSAFQTGYEEGTLKCASFADNPPRPTAIGFRSLDEASSGGNVPYEQAIDVAVTSLNGHFVGAVPGFEALPAPQRGTIDLINSVQAACGGRAVVSGTTVVVCPAQPAVAGGSLGAAVTAVNDDTLRGAYSIGDFAVASRLAFAWSAVVSGQFGFVPTSRLPTVDHVIACLNGSWLASAVNAPTISAGDIDEALILLLRLINPVPPFARVSAMRVGFNGGVNACR